MVELRSTLAGWGILINAIAVGCIAVGISVRIRKLLLHFESQSLSGTLASDERSNPNDLEELSN